MATRTGSETRIRIPPLPPLDQFSANELQAAEQLVQLSESSAESSAAEDNSSCSLSATNTPRTVSTGCPLVSITENNDDEDVDEMGPKRKNHRYRLISDFYDDQKPIDGLNKRTNRRRRKQGDDI